MCSVTHNCVQSKGKKSVEADRVELTLSSFAGESSKRKKLVEGERVKKEISRGRKRKFLCEISLPKRRKSKALLFLPLLQKLVEGERVE